jgi:CRP-like cAMP-binding protein
MGMVPAFEQVLRPLFPVVPPRPSPVRVSSTSVGLIGKLEALRGLALFSGAVDAELQRLAEASLLRRFEQGRVMLRGAAGDEVVILVRGRAKSTIPRGVACGEFALGLYEAGDIVSEGCWAQGGPAGTGETVALEDSAAFFLPRRALEAFFERNPRTTLRFLEAISGKLGRIIALAAQNSCLEVGDRLYRSLVELSQTRGRACAEGIHIQHGLHQRELAASIGASREVVNRQLAQWRDAGFVESGRKFVVVKNPVGLTLAVSAAVRGDGFPTLGSLSDETREVQGK